MVPTGCVGALVVSVYNTDANGRRCLGGLARVRGRCLGTVGLQSLQGCEKCDVMSARGNDVVAGGSFNTSLCVEKFIVRNFR